MSFMKFKVDSGDTAPFFIFFIRPLFQMKRIAGASSLAPKQQGLWLKNQSPCLFALASQLQVLRREQFIYKLPI
jgi:hypothetical protein